MRRLAAAAVAALALAGCGADEGITGGGRIIGDTLTVASLMPLSGPQAAVGRDIVDGQKLALAEAGGRAGAFTINFAVFDEGAEDRAEERDAAARAARAAIGDRQVAVVVGSLGSEAAAVSIPLLNAAGMLQISPGAGYPGFTESPNWYPSGVVSFGRVVADDRAQARAIADRLRALGRTRVAIESEPGVAAEAFAAAVRAQDGLEIVGEEARADAVVYAGRDPANAAGVAEGLAREAPRARIVFGDDLVRAGIEAALPAAARRRALLASRAPEAGSSPALRRFEAAFAARFGRRPGAYAILGHAAMRAALATIAAAGDEAADRSELIATFRADPPPIVQPPFTIRAAG
jgi:branched-chain amino acid transport system substrate-binding protein